MSNNSKLKNQEKLKPYFETENGSVYNCDCMDLMKTFPDNHIDLTVTSPPYDNLRTYNNNIDQTWCEEVWMDIIEELYRVTKKGGVVVWVVGDATINGSETGTSFKQALWFIQCGFNLHDTMIYKSDKPPLTHNRYEQCFEYMFILSKSKPKSFNPIMKKNKHYGANALRDGTCESGKQNCAIRQRKGYSKTKLFGITNNIWNFKTGGFTSTKDKVAFNHPAIFPEVLANDHIVSWSNETDLIFDPFTGSGTTFKMALENKRRFIGSELSQEYCEIIKRRIKQSTAQLTLPGF